MVADAAVNDGDGDTLTVPAAGISNVRANRLPEVVERTGIRLAVGRDIGNLRIGCEGLYRAPRQPEMSAFDRMQLPGRRAAACLNLAKASCIWFVLDLHAQINQAI